MPEERANAVTFQGSPLTLIGNEIKAGDAAPGFTGLAGDLSDITLATDKGKVRVFLSVPSLDTGVCDAEARRFNESAAGFADNVVVYTVSCDLPFAQGRWCGAADAANLKTLSDHRSVSFGDAYGTHIKELRLLSRAVFVVDQNDVVQYAEYIPEITEHPDYEAAFAAIGKITG